MTKIKLRLQRLILHISGAPLTSWRWLSFPSSPFFPWTGTAGGCGKWSRPIVFGVRQEKWHRDGGLVSEKSYWSEWWCIMATYWGLKGEAAGWRRGETADLMVLTFSQRLYLRLSNGSCMFWLASPSVSVWRLPARPSWSSLPLCCLAALLPGGVHVFRLFAFLSARLSVSRVYLSAVKTFHWLSVTKWGLKC